MQSIIAATEFSERCTLATERARLLAQEAEVELVLVHAGSDDRLKPEFEAVAEGMGARPLFRKGEPCRIILDAVSETDAGLIVLGAPGRRGLRETIRGTTAEQVIRNASVSVLMVAGQKMERYERIFFATDFSDASRQAVTALKDNPVMAGARLTLLNIFDAPATPLMTRAGTSIPDVEAYISEQGRQSSVQLQAFADRTGFGKAGLVSKLGRETTGRAICAAAEADDADLIVVGTRGRSGIARFVLGSVAEEVLRLSGRDVLAIPVKA